MFVSLSAYLSIYLSICLSIYQSIYLPICLSTGLKTKLFCATSSIFELDNIRSAAILRDFFNFRTWQRQNRNNSARLPQFSKLTTSKTKQLSETSFKNWKFSAELTASYQCVLRFLHSICLKYRACHEKIGQVERSAAPVTQNHLSKPEDRMLQNATSLMKSAPSPPNICEEHVYKTHHARAIFGSWDVEKVRAVVARSAFPSQNAQNT